MSRTAPALASIFLALLLSARSPVAQRDVRPRTPADSLRAWVEPLFVAADYDSILSLLPAYIRRAEATRDSVLLGRAITQRGRVYLARGDRAHAERDIDLGIRIAESVRDTVSLMSAVNFRGFAYAGQGDYVRAMRCYQRRLELALAFRSPADEGWARTSIAAS
jgi:tetratricopeptide (TPR) repeat protein